MLSPYQHWLSPLAGALPPLEEAFYGAQVPERPSVREIGGDRPRIWQIGQGLAARLGWETVPSKLAPELVTAALQETLALVAWLGSWKEESEKKKGAPWKSGWLQGRLGSGRGKKTGQGPAEV